MCYNQYRRVRVLLVRLFTILGLSNPSRTIYISMLIYLSFWELKFLSDLVTCGFQSFIAERSEIVRVLRVFFFFLKLPRAVESFHVNEREEENRRASEGATERRWALQFISVGLISVASRGLRLTFRWSFVRRSTEGENGHGEGEEEDRQGGAKGGCADRLFYGNILVGHTVCRRGRRSRRRSGVEEENGQGTRMVLTNKTAVPFEGTSKAPGQSGPPLISFLLPTLARLPERPA